MDKRKSVINVSVSIFFKLALLIGNLFVRRFFIKFIGNEANGLESLYTSVIGILSVAELGIGAAITFCMYKPIVEGDEEKVSALYNLFKKLYFIIGIIIMIGGCLTMPLLPHLAKDYTATNINIYLTFALMLVSVVLTYAFSAKISLINAYKNNYISTLINSGGLLLQCGLQMIVLSTIRSFVAYSACRIIAVLAQWLITEIITHKKYNQIISQKHTVDTITKKEVVKNVKAMFMHKAGGALIRTTDSIIISAFIGVVILGKYTNYTVIMLAMYEAITLFFTPLTSVIGHMAIEENRESLQKYYNFFYIFNYIIGCVFFLGYYSVIDNLIAICFGSDLLLSKSISFILTLNYFIQFMRQSTVLFRDATGTFYNDRWRPIIEGVINIILSIAFVYLFEYLWGANFAVVGVIVATIMTNLFICHFIEPWVLYKSVLRKSVKGFYVKNYVCIFLFAVALIVLHLTMISNNNLWIELFANGGISIAFSVIIALLMIACNKDLRFYIKAAVHRFKKKKV